VLEEFAFMSNDLPCNSIPFLTRLHELLDEAQTNELAELPEEGKLKARACMWVLMTQAYGQTATIDLSEEWHSLNAALNPSIRAATYTAEQGVSLPLTSCRDSRKMPGRR